ncbi:unnamed protein product [Caenorhabditis auriculariae]|uniref:Uncharacterized protein n=1 Tax=Caenorhabditis auriculariae TaxID=2777116 RepID=A0A8S1HSW6_9PELO|nr:unnamed protein product [Caenorhabditis auriculariae]
MSKRSKPADSPTKKPSTDFAKKAVIQGPKLEKVKVAKVETKLAEAPKPPKVEKVEEKAESPPKTSVAANKVEMEDKSAVRKSALNMKDEDAKKKAAADEKAAAQKARRFGTVTALADRFKEPVKTEEPILYKRSSRLVAKDEEKPRRKYEIVKPVLNDDFDKQMEEIRMQMKSGSNQLQSQMKEMSKGIASVSSEAKNSAMEQKRRDVVQKATGAFGKAEEEKARWKAQRDAESEREFARIEAEKHLKKKKIPVVEKPQVSEEPKPEPKRTIRRIFRPPEPGANVPSFASCGPKTEVKPQPEVRPPVAAVPEGSPMARRKKSVGDVSVKSDIRETSNSPILKAVPKGDGAAATKIRNAMTSSPMGSEKSAKRYATRRKTQELVNESAQPKKRRKESSRKKRFIRTVHDIDALLGFQISATFEQLEKLFELSAKDKISTVNGSQKRVRRLKPTKIYISDLTDIDKLYKASEIRDIIASPSQFLPPPQPTNSMLIGLSARGAISPMAYRNPAVSNEPSFLALLMVLVMLGKWIEGIFMVKI